MSKKDIKIRWDNARTTDLIQAILALKNQAEAKRFLRDLLTENELLEFANRWRAAQMLSKHIPYTQIEDETQLSSTTVARVARWLWKGKGGYRLMLNRLSSHHADSTF